MHHTAVVSGSVLTNEHGRNHLCEFFTISMQKSQNGKGNIFEEHVRVASDAVSYSKRKNKVTYSGYDSIPLAVSGTHGKGRYM